MPERLTVANALGLPDWLGDRPTTLVGRLFVTEQFAYLATTDDAPVGVLIYEPKLAATFLRRFPAGGGSAILYWGDGTVNGLLRSGTALPMFPRMLHSISEVVFEQDGHPAELVRL